ncbi:MAG: BlaR1 family beta-lactam sensor/signal transducer [Lachnospiraceae bacterium]|nr:BlaR1 family beta-lactam sensor/signal transducer [Lachnospiraceae bacterium]
MRFPIHFLLCNIMISLLLGIFFLIKKGLKKHLTPYVQYDLWYIFVFALLLPFLPYEIFSPSGLWRQIWSLIPKSSAQTISTLSKAASASINVADTFHTEYDIAAASSHSAFYKTLWIIWTAGMILTACYFLFSIMKVHIYRRQAYSVTSQNEPELYKQFRSCADELRIRRRIRLYASCSISNPVSYGLLHPIIMIPQDLDILLPKDELRFIFLHELQHYKQKDMILNHLTCFWQILYWFNPFIWYGFRQFRNDREIACDHSVLRVIGSKNSVNYGHALLKYAGQMQKDLFAAPFSTMGGSNHTIRQRIREIAAYQRATVSQRIVSAGIFLFSLILICCSSPLLMHTAASDYASVTLNGKTIRTIDVSPFFHGIDGSFVLYDMSNNEYRLYNEELCTKRISPDSTFKIYSGLFALEEHIISADASSIKWDGTNQPFAAWNQDQTLDSAMKNSVNWYFQNLDHKLGISKLSQYYHRISYGNCDLTGGIGEYWAESSLKISPFEQTELLTDLLTNKWIFQEENIQMIRNSLYLTDMNNGKLYGKTGSGMVDGKNVNGWFIGFFEQGTDTYCFALNLKNSESASGSTAMKMTMDILNYIF